MKTKEVHKLFAENSRVHLIIYGRVQGVFFRDFAKKAADALHLTGWVKNLEDGSVEVVAEGDKTHLKEFVSKCEDGPAIANVSDVEVKWGEYQGRFEGFFIKY